MVMELRDKGRGNRQSRCHGLVESKFQSDLRLICWPDLATHGSNRKDRDYPYFLEK